MKMGRVFWRFLYFYTMLGEKRGMRARCEAAGAVSGAVDSYSALAPRTSPSCVAAIGRESATESNKRIARRANERCRCVHVASHDA